MEVVAKHQPSRSPWQVQAWPLGLLTQHQARVCEGVACRPQMRARDLQRRDHDQPAMGQQRSSVALASYPSCREQLERWRALFYRSSAWSPLCASWQGMKQ